MPKLATSCARGDKVELEFLYSARSLADRLEKQRLFQRLFTGVPMPDDAYERASEIQQRLTETGQGQPVRLVTGTN
jgi:predicted nucleic acid-binding protein